MSTSKASNEIGRSLAKTTDALLMRYLDLAIAAAEWRIRLAPSDIVNPAIVARLKDIKRDLTPKPPPPIEPPIVYFEEYDHIYDPHRSIDDLVAGAPPLVEAQLRDILEGTE